jgi:transposase
MVRKTTIPNPELVEFHLEREVDANIRVRLMLLNLVAKLDGGFKLAEICELLKIPVSTASVWIRRWREERYPGIAHPWPTTGRPIGRPPTLNDADLAYLKVRLAEKPHWQTKEIVELIHQTWDVSLSVSQVQRILKDKLHVPFGKPYPHDYRRPQDAEERLEELLLESYNRLINKWFKKNEIAFGFVDETSPQTTANTARVWHVGSADSTKNTTRYKANAVGFYALIGHSVSEFLPDSTQESIEGFFRKIREANPEYPAIIVVLDNFSSHKAKTVQDAANALNIELLYLPPYSPDLNPIEFIWKTVKRAVSLEFIRSLSHLREVISETWDKASHHCSYAKSWIEKFLPGVIDNREFCG